MIKRITAHTSTRNGNTIYHVYYESGRMRTLRKYDNWPLSVVKFFLSENTKVVDNRICGTSHYECYEHV